MWEAKKWRWGDWGVGWGGVGGVSNKVSVCFWPLGRDGVSDDHTLNQGEIHSKSVEAPRNNWQSCYMLQSQLGAILSTQ